MSLFKRIKNILQSPEPSKPEKTILTVGPGDVVEVSMITYQVIGKTHHALRNANLLTLQDGTTIQYLYCEDRERSAFALYNPIDGRLDSFNEVPTTLDLDGVSYFLEEQFSGMVTTDGKTPFSGSGEQYVWQFQSDDRKLLRVEWQNGRFMMYEGESILPADVQILHGV